MNAPTPTHRRAFTLVEAAISLFILSIMMAALTSATIFLTHAVPGESSASADAAALSLAIERLQEETMLAIRVEDQDSSLVTLSLADRDGDANPEVVTYNWAGPGASLERSVGGADAEAVTPPLDAFAAATVAVPNDDDPLLGRPIGTLQTLGDDQGATWLTMDSLQLYQPIRPDLDGSVTGWALDTLTLHLGYDTNAGDDDATLTCELYFDDGAAQPAGDILATVSVTLTPRHASGVAVDIDFDDPLLVTAGQNLGVRLTTVEDGPLILLEPAALDDPQLGVFNAYMGYWMTIPSIVVCHAEGRTTTEPIVAELVTRIDYSFTHATLGEIRFGATPLAPAEHVE